MDERRTVHAGHYHVGIVVDDIEAARVRLSGTLGVSWGPVLRLGSSAYRDGGGTDLELPTTMCYSTGTPCLELIEEVPGTPWVRNEHSNLHHVGFWSDHLEADSHELGAVGCPLQLCGRAGDDAPVSFAYHRDDHLGIRIELVDASMREAMAFLFEADTGS
jgi:catechol 2,3-dioxygenase-like lactoylglutathione lyase family enzyme